MDEKIKATQEQYNFIVEHLKAFENVCLAVECLGKDKSENSYEYAQWLKSKILESFEIEGE